MKPSGFLKKSKGDDMRSLVIERSKPIGNQALGLISIESKGRTESCKFNTKVLNLIDFGNLDDSNESERFRGCYDRFVFIQ